MRVTPAATRPTHRRGTVMAGNANQRRSGGGILDSHRAECDAPERHEQAPMAIGG